MIKVYDTLIFSKILIKILKLLRGIMFTKKNNFNKTNISTDHLSQKLLAKVASYKSCPDEEILETIKLLLDSGASATEIIKCGDSALSLATRLNLTPIVEKFIQKGVDINAKFPAMWQLKNGDKAGFAASALSTSIEYGFFEMTQLLVTSGASLDVDSKIKISPLHIAINKEDLSFISLLVNHGADLYSKDHFYQQTSIDWANETQNTEIISYFSDYIKLNGEIEPVCE
jgi:ankyrin repeat protein